MSTLRGEQGLRDLADAGQGAQTDAAAVFGLGGAAFVEPPAWLRDQAAVRRRLNAKPADDGISATHWPGVVELARQCASVAGTVTDDGSAPAGTVHRALTLSTALARRLPKPPTALLDADAFPAKPDAAEDRLEESDDALRGPVGLGGADPSCLLGHWQDRLREETCRLADAVDDRWWTDPDALAGVVDDTRRVLAAYLVTVMRLDALPIPRRPHRVRNVSPGLTRHHVDS